LPVLSAGLLVLLSISPAWGEELEPATPASTSLDEVLAGNPIKLTISKESPASELPTITGPIALAEAVQIGLNSNLWLKQSELSWIISKFEARSALGQLGPAASFSTFYAHSSIQQMLVANPAVNPAPMQPIDKFNSLHLIFAGTQPLFTGGRLFGAYRAARARERQSLAGYQADRIATALKVKLAYWEAAWNEARLRVTADYVKSKSWSRDNMKARMQEGKAIKADYLREEAELSRARDALNQNYRDFNTSLIKLKTELSINLGSQIDLKDALEYAETEHDLNFYLEAAERNRPEIAQAGSKIAEMQAKRQVALSKYSPQLNLYGLGSNATGNTPGVAGEAEGRWGGVVAIIGGITLFDSGSRLNDLRAASAAVRQASIAKQGTELKVAEDVSLAWIDLDTAKRNVELARDQVQAAEEEQRLFHMRYLVGKAIALEDFDAAVRLFRARLSLLEVIYNYCTAQARLSWASGVI